MSKEFLSSIFEKVKEKGIIDDELIKYLEEIFPNSSARILETIKRGITRYIYKPSNRVVWTALGEEKEYLIYPKLYCSCQYFYLKVVNGKRNFCKHVIAQIICEALRNYKNVELEDFEYKNRIKYLKLKL